MAKKPYTVLAVTDADHSRKHWLENRAKTGIGGSEVGSILGLNEYQSSAELFYLKVGEMPLKDRDNIAMLQGRLDEPKVAMLWQHWEGSQESVVENVNAKRIIRKCRKPKYMYVSRERPHMFANPDRLIDHGFTTDNGIFPVHKDSVLEIKTISGWVTKRWVGGVPPIYLFQIHHYMYVLGSDYAEMAIQEDGRYIDVLPFRRRQSLIDNITESCDWFWDLVVKGREVKVYYDNAISLTDNPEQRHVFAQKKEQELANLCPPPDGSESYLKFLNEKYDRSSPRTVKPTLPVMNHIKAAIRLAAEISDLEVKERMALNTIKSYMGVADKLDLGPAGSILWRSDKNGNRRFRWSSIKEEKLAQTELTDYVAPERGPVVREPLSSKLHFGESEPPKGFDVF